MTDPPHQCSTRHTTRAGQARDSAGRQLIGPRDHTKRTQSFLESFAEFAADGLRVFDSAGEIANFTAKAHLHQLRGRLRRQRHSGLVLRLRVRIRRVRRIRLGVHRHGAIAIARVRRLRMRPVGERQRRRGGTDGGARGIVPRGRSGGGGTSLVLTRAGERGPLITDDTNTRLRMPPIRLLARDSVRQRCVRNTYRTHRRFRRGGRGVGTAPRRRRRRRTGRALLRPLPRGPRAVLPLEARAAVANVIHLRSGQRTADSAQTESTESAQCTTWQHSEDQALESRRNE